MSRGLTRRRFMGGLVVVSAGLAAVDTLTGCEREKEPQPQRVPQREPYGDGPVDVREFGAKGDGSSNDRASLQAAIAAAVEAGVSLRIPKGRYKVVYSADEDSLHVAGDLEIIGAGRDLTVLEFGPDSTSFPYDGLRLANGARVRVRDLGLRGPAHVLAPEDSPPTKGVRHGSGTRAGETHLMNVAVVGNFINAIEFGGDNDGLLHLVDCVIESWGVSVAVGGAARSLKKRFSASRTEFKGPQTTTDGALIHSIYPNPNVSIEIEDCVFSKSTRRGYCIHHWGSSNEAPTAAVVRRCTFKGPIYGAILAAGTGFTEISACEFEGIRGSAVQVFAKGSANSERLGASIDGCTFRRCRTAVSYRASERPFQVQVTRSTFEDCATGVNVGIGESTWTLRDCQFIAAGDVDYFVNDTSHPAAVSVETCGFFARQRSFTDGTVEAGSRLLTSASARFDQTDIGKLVGVLGAGPPKEPVLMTTIVSIDSPVRAFLAGPAATGVDAALVAIGGEAANGLALKSGRISVRRCTFEGNFGEGGMINVKRGGNRPVVEVSDSDFRVLGKHPAIVTAPSTAAAVREHGNRFMPAGLARGVVRE